MKVKSFQDSRRFNMNEVFRSWRIFALSKAYLRESEEYQTMLSVTTTTLNRKDVAIAEAEAKVSSMAHIIEGLTESNNQLMKRVDQLERSQPAQNTFEYLAPANTEIPPTFSRSPDIDFEEVDTLQTEDDEKSDRVNHMLLETLFGMARMVESSAIQLAKDTMDSLEYQLDGSMLENLAQMVQAEQELKIKNQPKQGATLASYPSNGERTRHNAKGPIQIQDLAQMPVDVFLLHWFKMNLQMSSAVQKASDRTIKNFTTDLCDGRRLSFLLHRLFPSWFDSAMVHELDIDERLQNIATFHSKFQPELPQVVTSDSIHAASAIENVAFVGMLFGASVGPARKVNLEKQRGDLLSVVTSWRRVRSLLLEVKRMTNNYDSIMIMHLLKEMRSCESLFRSLRGEITSIAIASNETASALSQIAYKVLDLTWRCLHVKINNLPPSSLKIIDQRWEERTKEFVEINDLTIQLILDKQSEHEFQEAGRSKGRNDSARLSINAPKPVVWTDRDIQERTGALRSSLEAHSRDLYEIYKYYSASASAGSIASMSLSEFNKFAKDCQLLDCFTPLTIEKVFRFVLPTPEAQDDEGVPERTSLDEQELSGNQFALMLIQLSSLKYTSGNLDQRFEAFMEKDILPHAVRSQTEIFRQEVASPKIRAIFQRYKVALQAIFRYYASMHAVRQAQSTMSYVEFQVLGKDCKFLRSFVSEHGLKQVLVQAQREEYSTADMSNDSDLRVDFYEFQEALAALTHYVVCNPYMSFAARLEQFLLETILPRARQKQR